MPLKANPPGTAVPGIREPALVVLRKREDGYCVRAVWGYSFGGLGVGLQTTSVSFPRAETVLVTLAATATYNNPVDDLSDPTAPRRIALAIGENQSLVLADSMLNATFAPYDRNHRYFEHDELVIVDGDRLKRWRFDLTSGQPSRVP